jgi:hypothetical protein
MSPTIEIDPEADQPPSPGGGVYATRSWRKGIDETLAKDQTKQKSDEEDASIIEKDVIDERDVRRKQVLTWTTPLATQQLTMNLSRLENCKRYGELPNIPVTLRVRY